MANPEHLAILKQGVGVWNKWIDENRRDVIPDLYKADMRGHNLRGAELVGANLSEADLRKADLIGADLIGAELVGADLRWANLIKTDLRWANLSNADLTNADLTNADLLQSQVISTNFNQAILTGSCIKDWQINSETNLDGVICEYIYLEDIFYFGEYESKRRPINGNFAPGEFASLYKKILENIDLILRKTPENDNTVNKPEKNIDVDNTSNNQGVQFYANSTIHTWERLRFRSKTEIKIAEALDRTEVLFVPNSLARLTTPKGRE